MALHGVATAYDLVRRPQVERKGLEPVSATDDILTTCDEGDHPRGTESGTLAARDPTPEAPGADPDLALVVHVWPALPEATRRQILDIIREAAANRQAVE